MVYCSGTDPALNDTMQHTDSKCISQDVKKLITAGLTKKYMNAQFI